MANIFASVWHSTKILTNVFEWFLKIPIPASIDDKQSNLGKYLHYFTVTNLAKNDILCRIGWDLRICKNDYYLDLKVKI